MVRDSIPSMYETTEKHILKKIEDIKCNDSTILSLDNKNLIEIPRNILYLNQLNLLSLNGNHIRALPDEFYKAFPQLTWLDLRCNELESISRAVVNLSNLKNLLIGNNNIRRLCIELGGVKSLTGLNIGGNPIEFPSQDILSKGSCSIIRYFRECYLRRLELEKVLSGEVIKKAFTENGNGGEVLEYLDQLATEIVNNQIKSEESKTSVNDSTLYKSKLYRRFKREASALNKVQKCAHFHLRPSDRKAFLHQAKDKLVSIECIYKSELNEIRQLKCKMENIRRDRILQRLKNKEVIDDWKVDYRIRKSALSDIYKYKPREDIKEESLNRIRIVPYAINDDEISVMSQYDLEQLKFAPKPGISPTPRPRPISADSVLKLEMARRNEDKKLIDDVNKQAEFLNLKIENPCLPLSVSDAEADLVNALQLQLRLRNRQNVITQLKMSTHPTAFLM